MYIDYIEIKNYKGFQNINLKLHSNLNVFIGSNASGKTSLLTALIKSIFNLTQNFASPEEHNELLFLTDDDINYNSNACYIEIIIKDFPKYEKDIVSITSKIQPGSDLNFGIESKTQEQNKFIQWYHKEVQKSFQTVPIFKFYPANRGSVHYTNASHNRVYRISQLETWSNIYQSSLSYSKFFQWFFDYETSELRLQRDVNDFSIEIPELKGVRLALIKAFEMLNYGEVKVLTKPLNSPSMPIKNGKLAQVCRVSFERCVLVPCN